MDHVGIYSAMKMQSIDVTNVRKLDSAVRDVLKKVVTLEDVQEEMRSKLFLLFCYTTTTTTTKLNKS